MANSWSNYLEAAVLNHVFRNTALTSPTTVYLALFSTAAGEAGGGTELTGNGYARLATAFDAPSPSNQIINTDTETFTASGGAWLAIVGHSMFDAVTVGNDLCFEDSVSGPTLADGDSYEFGPGDITITLD